MSSEPVMIEEFVWLVSTTLSYKSEERTRCTAVPTADRAVPVVKSVSAISHEEKRMVLWLGGVRLSCLVFRVQSVVQPEPAV